MRTSAIPRRARALVGLGLAITLSGATVGTAAPGEESKCATTVCATAGARVEIVCAHPDTKTVTCEGIATVWGSGRMSSPAGTPGTIDWRGEARCGGSCNQSELAQGAGAWNGVTSRSTQFHKVIYFPSERRSSSTRTCFLYTLGVNTVATARTISPLSVSLDKAEVASSAYHEAYACNEV